MDGKEQRQHKTVQQIIDGQEKEAPMRHAPRVYSDKREPPESARRHMRHRPYQRGGDASGSENRKREEKRVPMALSECETERSGNQ